MSNWGDVPVKVSINGKAAENSDAVASDFATGQRQTIDRLEFTIENPGHRRGAGRKFGLQTPQPDGSWKTVHSGKIHGMIYAKRFAPVTAQKLRLNLDAPVSQFDLFPPVKRLGNEEAATLGGAVFLKMPRFSRFTKFPQITHNTEPS